MYSSLAEEPGIGKALGGVVGISVGGAVGAELGAAAASLFFPGVGPVLATGIMGAALLGLGGAVGGAKLGRKLDESLTEGLPVDELYVYKDALRKGRSVLIAPAKDDRQAELARKAMEEAGADSVDSARLNSETRGAQPEYLPAGQPGDRTLDICPGAHASSVTSLPPDSLDLYRAPVPGRYAKLKFKSLHLHSTLALKPSRLDCQDTFGKVIDEISDRVHATVNQ